MKNQVKGYERAKQILKYTDSESNELMIGVLHMCILPFAMFELGSPWMLLQIGAHLAGIFQLYCVLWNGTLWMREIAVKIATVISIATVINYTLGGMMSGSHLGWVLVCVMSIWNLYRVTNESISKR